MSGTGATVAVVGPGAVGAAVASAVQATGRHDLALCARRAVPQLTVERPGAEPLRIEAPVLLDPSAAKPADWVLLAVKAHQTNGAAAWLRRLTGPASVVVVLQNGVRHHDRVAPYVGQADVLPSSIWIAAEAVESAVRLGADTRIRVPDSESGRRFAELLRGSWISVEVVADFALESWRKLTLNAVSSLMALSGRRAVMFRAPDVLELAHRYALECAAVARAEGANLSDEEALALANLLATMDRATGTSILFDREKGVTLEWQARNGVIRDLGALHGIPTPISDVTVPLLAAASA